VIAGLIGLRTFVAMAIEDQQYNLDWGKGWLPLGEGNALQAELDRELILSIPYTVRVLPSLVAASHATTL
jgi:hypothetical protein